MSGDGKRFNEELSRLREELGMKQDSLENEIIRLDVMLGTLARRLGLKVRFTKQPGNEYLVEYVPSFDVVTAPPAAPQDEPEKEDPREAALRSEAALRIAELADDAVGPV